MKFEKEPLSFSELQKEKETETVENTTNWVLKLLNLSEKEGYNCYSAPEGAKCIKAKRKKKYFIVGSSLNEKNPKDLLTPEESKLVDNLAERSTMKGVAHSWFDFMSQSAAHKVDDEARSKRNMEDNQLERDKDAFLNNFKSRSMKY